MSKGGRNDQFLARGYFRCLFPSCFILRTSRGSWTGNEDLVLTAYCKRKELVGGASNKGMTILIEGAYISSDLVPLAVVVNKPIER